MRKLFLVLLILGVTIQAQSDREVEYVQKHAYLAVEEMEIYQIPASITLAQGILETGGGQSRLAEQAKNHFGIKCKKEWTGETITHDDDAIGECFRKYNSVQESYRDHSKFLAERPFYRKLFDLKLTDYKGWAHGLKKAGYATNPRYGYILISKIENLNLQEFDKIGKTDVYDKLVSLYGPVDRKLVDPLYKEEVMVAATPEPKKKPVVSEPKTKTMEVPKREISPRARVKRHPIGKEYIVVNQGETLSQIAKTYETEVDKLMKYNELDRPEDLRSDQYLFFAKKRNRGAKKYYKVQSGENMYVISQKTGIKLKQLLRRNRVDESYKPAIGETLYLRGRKPRK
ncbi:glucosaminidase domain-containing protein [Weeksellaceae bacterium KMM 9713]|uniref:Peptidoglycan hydrolase n=1 Tax=Profundicola chukchiensis TaxID=2961959 RepID=A0A9X4MZ92_9FLAO|nr:glucosaminidase domain-containing protein [Profundicola chukchiensis]MDG4945515.1 glucosaminidase domain-containing protein [Profundicola chukchiensis]